MKAFAFDHRDITSKTHVKEFLFTGWVFLLGYLLFLIPREDLAPLMVVLFGITLAIFIILMVEPEDFKYLFSLFMVGFGTRIFIALLIFLLSYQYGVADGFLFESDAHSYSQKGRYVAQCYKWGLKIDPNYAASKVASGTFTEYDLWCGLVYSHVGESPLTLCFINSLAGSLTIIFLYSLAKNLAGKKVAIIASIFAAFWPSLAMWSAQNLKDPLICFFLVLYFYACIELRKNLRLRFLPIMAISLFAMSRLSVYPAIIAFVGTCAGFLLSSTKNLTRSIIIAAIIVLAVAYFGMHHIENNLRDLQGLEFSKHFGLFFTNDSIFKMIDFQRHARAEGHLAILPDRDISSFTKALLYLPVGLLFIWFSPFPWQMGSALQLMALPEMLVFYLLFPRFLRGIRSLYQRSWSDVSVIIFFIIVMSLVFGLIEGNSGTLLRHRSYITYFCFIFMSAGIFREELVDSEKSNS